MKDLHIRGTLRVDLGRATRHAKDTALRTGKRISWKEARLRGKYWLFLMSGRSRQDWKELV